MSSISLPELWQAALEPLKKQFPGPTFVASFGSSELLSLNEQEIVIAVENKGVRDIVRKYGESTILSHIVSETGISPKEVVYKVHKKTSERKQSKQQNPSNPTFFKNQGHTTTVVGELEIDPHLEANLNPKYTFESFIMGNKNRLGFAAAQAVSQNLGTLYNPLYIFGGVGLGKTHLMQAIGNEVLKNHPNKRVLYVACEHFLNEFVTSIKKGNPDAFKRKYRGIDLFLVDDIQFIAGRDGVQEEFFHTFNALHQSNKQIVMSSDKKPSEIKGLEERLSSRFSMGMVTDIQLPDKDTRLAILQMKCQEKGFNLPIGILSYIAEEVETNIRELEGALNTVIADLMARNAQPTVSEVQKALHSIVSQQKAAKKSTALLLTEIVCGYFEISPEEITGARRQQELVKPRQILMYLLKHEAGMTYPKIGAVLGGRDHTTIMHGVEKITTELKKNTDLLADLQKIKNSFYEYT